MSYIAREHKVLGRIRWRWDWNMPLDAIRIEMECVNGPGFCVLTARPGETESMLLDRAEQKLIDYLYDRREHGYFG